MCEILKQNRLFKNFSEEELAIIYKALHAKVEDYKKGDIIINAHEMVPNFGIVLKGSISVYGIDYDGNVLIMANLMVNQAFGETFSTIKEPTVVNASCNEDTTILWLDYHHLVKYEMEEALKIRFMDQLLLHFAYKNFFLTNRMYHLSKKSIREKVCSYLLEEAHRQKTMRFIIPFNRQRLADYLSVDRSALSAVLSQLQKEKIIKYHRNEFWLLKGE